MPASAERNGLEWEGGWRKEGEKERRRGREGRRDLSGKQEVLIKLN